jgi:diguanylate cyclase (GGDEF)-like protein
MVTPIAMVVFVTGMLVFAGGKQGPLLNLYLLPIVTSAVTLGHGPTMLTCAMALAGRVALSHYVEGADVATISYGLTAMAEAAPVLLVAVWTTMLADGIRQAGDRLQAASDRDEVTGLLSLKAFTRLLCDEHALACRRRDHYALVLVDVDGLKSVNESLGHEAGNRVLAAVGQALKRSARTADLVGRSGGDEFLVFLSGAGPGISKAVANRIRHNVATTTVDVGGRLHRLTVNIGTAVFPEDGRDVRDLIKVADRAAQIDRENRHPLPLAMTPTSD